MVPIIVVSLGLWALAGLSAIGVVLEKAGPCPAILTPVAYPAILLGGPITLLGLLLVDD